MRTADSAGLQHKRLAAELVAQMAGSFRTRRARIIRYAEDAASLQQAADALQRRSASLEATLPCTTTPPPAVITELPGSTWRFACRLDEGKSFDFVATLERKRTPTILLTTRIAIGRRDL